MNALSLIDEREVLGKEFRIYGTVETPLFLAKDVAEWIDYTQIRPGTYNVSAMLLKIDEDEKLVSTIMIQGQNREAWFLTEGGLYEVLMQSRKPIAKQFKRQVKQILKQIRQTGGYIPIEENDSDEDFLARAVLVARRTIEKKNTIIMQQQERIEQDKPKVLFADSVSASSSSILVGELAKLLKQNGIEMGQKRLFAWLRDKGYLIKRRGTDYNMPTQRSMELGLFEIKETSITHSDGHISINKTSKVTGKGQVYFINKFLN